jgi:outer membrane lipoprotein LolB
MSGARLAAALAAALLVSACATFRVGTDGLSFAERRARLEAVPAWQVRGAIVVDTAEEGATTLRFAWLQDREHLTLNVRSRLGPSVLQVEGTPDELIVTARGDRYELTDPETELTALLDGWWLPVTSFRSWLLGFPDADYRADSERGADGTLERLTQRLWDVEYPTYQLVSTPQGDALVPRQIELEHDDLTLLVTITEWAPLDPRDAP